jgi:hypothetical protein
MVPLAFMDGVWRGPAWVIGPSGERHTITQTERIGPFLDGSVKVIEGRGYDSEGKVTFDAFGTISYRVSVGESDGGAVRLNARLAGQRVTDRE